MKKEKLEIRFSDFKADNQIELVKDEIEIDTEQITSNIQQLATTQAAINISLMEQFQYNNTLHIFENCLLKTTLTIPCSAALTVKDVKNLISNKIGKSSANFDLEMVDTGKTLLLDNYSFNSYSLCGKNTASVKIISPNKIY